MKKLNINNAGRMPLWQKDLDFIQAGFTEPIEALVGELGMSKDYFIITGCSPYMPDKNHIAMNKGWFCYGGHVLPVRPLPSTSITSFNNPMVRLVPVSFSDPAGARSFIRADQTVESVADVWQDDYLQPSVVERASSFTYGVRLGVGAWTLLDIIAHRSSGGESEWIKGQSGDLEFKRIGHMVILRGMAANMTTTAQPVDGGFPVPLAGKAMLHIPDQPEGCNIYINSDGELVCQSTGVMGEPVLTGMMYMSATPYVSNDPNTLNDNSIVNPTPVQ